jgi:outer membrane protein
MKKLSLIIIASVFFGLAGQKLNAQELKFGHIDSQELIMALPDYDTAVARLERFGRELSNNLELMQVEFNNKFVAFERDAETLTDIVRQARGQELEDLNRRIQEFQQAAQQQMQERQAEYFQPIMEKVEKAIKDVGRENGFVYIFIVGQGSSLIYFDEVKSTDIMSLAKAKRCIR